MQEVVLAGIDLVGLSGLMSACSLPADRGIATVLRSNMHYPVRMASMGDPETHSGCQRWRVACAAIDTDELVVIDEPELDAATVRGMVERAIGAACSVALVEAEKRDERGYEVAWLARIPVSATARFLRWRSQGFGLLVDGRRMAARPAPLTRPVGARAGGGDDRVMRAAGAQKDVGERTYSGGGVLVHGLGTTGA